MGTMLALLLVLGTLSGCAVGTMANLKNALPEVPAAITCSVEPVTHAGTIRGDDGTVLAEYSYELPMMQILLEDGSPLEEAATPEQEQALAMAETFNACFIPWLSTAQDLARTAEEDNALRAENGIPPLPYTDTLQCTVYQTGQLISVSGEYYTFTGGAHGNSILLSWNFDLDTGEFFDPEILDGDGTLRSTVQEALDSQAHINAGAAPVKGYYWEDYLETLGNWSSYAVSFDEDGMTVGFSPYELASYAAGPQVFHLRYDQFSSCLSQHGLDLLGL